MSKRYGAETVSTIMSTNVPTCRLDDTQSTVFSVVASRRWDSVHNVYAVDDQNKLVGIVHINTLLRSKRDTRVEAMMVKPKVVLSPGEDQERAVFEAIKNDIIAIAVADENGQFMGAVTAYHIIDVMHDEHAEDALITAGIHGGVNRVIRETSKRSSILVRGRAPWLIFGLVMGMALAVLARFFEDSLQESVAIAYFIPVVAYIAGAVGTQSGAIAVRALATIKFGAGIYILKEFFIGAILGVIVGVLGAVAAAFIAMSPIVGLVVGMSLLAASVVSSVLAAVIPIVFKALGKDPALGSGPLATALQDIISILVYFVFASALI